MDHREILRQQVIAPDHGGLCAVLAGQRQKRHFQLCRSQVGRRRVDQVARQAFAGGNRLDPRGIAAHRRFQPRAGHLCRVIAVKPVMRQKPAQRRLVPVGLGQISHQMPVPVRQGRHGAGQREPSPRPGLWRAEAEDGPRHTISPRKQHHVPQCCREPRRLHPAPQRIALPCQPVRQIGGSKDMKRARRAVSIGKAGGHGSVIRVRAKHASQPSRSGLLRKPCRPPTATGPARPCPLTVTLPPPGSAAPRRRQRRWHRTGPCRCAPRRRSDPG